MYVGALISKYDTTDLYYPQVSHAATAVVKTANATLTVAEASGLVVNTGAVGTITLTLPKCADMKGKCLKAAALAAQIIRLDPDGTEQIFYSGSGVAGKYLNLAAVIGNSVDLFCDGSKWIVTGANGVLTKEA